MISVAAELAGLHPQTLRIYERKGLVDPARTGGGSRRYSDEDIAQLRRIQELTSEGLNLAGVQKVLELEAELAELRRSALERGTRGRRAGRASRPTASTAATSSPSTSRSPSSVTGSRRMVLVQSSWPIFDDPARPSTSQRRGSREGVWTLGCTAVG